MKIKFVLTLFLLFVFNCLKGQEADSLVAKLNEAYQDQNVDKIFQLLPETSCQDSLVSTVQFYKGWAYGQKYHFAEAIACLEKALQADSSDYRSVRVLGNVYLKTGQTNKAFELYDSIYQKHKSPLWLANKFAELCNKTKKYSQAASIYSSLIQQDSLNYYYYKKLGNTLFKMRQNKHAMQAYFTAYKLNPYDLSLYNKLGNLALRMKKFSKAKEYAKLGLEIDSINTDFISIIGYACFKQEKHDSALTCFDKALRLGDTSTFNYKYAGLACYDRKDYDSSIVYLKKGYAQDTSDIQLMFYLGSALSRSGSMKEGKEFLFKALNLLRPSKNSLIDMYSEIALAYNEMSMPKRALHFYKKAYKTKAKPILSFQMANIYDHKLKKKKMAKTYYQHFLATLPEKDSISEKKPPKVSKTISLEDYAQQRIKTINEELFFEGEKETINEQKK